MRLLIDWLLGPLDRRVRRIVREEVRASDPEQIAADWDEAIRKVRKARNPGGQS